MLLSNIHIKSDIPDLILLGNWLQFGFPKYFQTNAGIVHRLGQCFSKAGPREALLEFVILVF